MMENKKNTIQTETEFDIGQMFRIILMQSKLILIISLIGTSFGVYSYLSSDKIYKINSLLQSYSPQSSSITSDLFSSLNMNNNVADVKNYEQIYKSRTNILDIIKSKKLNLQFDEESINYPEIEKFLVLSPDNRQDYYLSFLNDSFSIKDENGEEIINSKYGNFNNENFSLRITKPKGELAQNLKLTYYKPEFLYNNIRLQFNVKTSEERYYISRGSELFEVSYITKNPDRGVEILNYANNLFIKNNIKSESEEARKALTFINLNLQKVEADLEVDKENLKNFQESNKSVNVDLEIRSIIETIASIETQISEIDIELAKAANSFTKTNPIYLEFIQQKEELLKQKSLIEDRIKDLPIAQQEFIDLSRALEMKQEVYSQLVTKQLEFSIREASTLGNIKIIDSAYIVEKISPRIQSIFLFGLLSLFLAIFFSLIRGYFYLAISNPAEIADRNITTPITGVIPVVSEDEGIEDNERYMQAVQSLIVNINNLFDSNHSKTKRLMITSPTPKNGKTFISRNLALRLSQLGKKVLLFDGDWKRGDLHKSLNKNKISLKEFSLFSKTLISTR